MQDFLSTINSVGFPIAACAALGYFVKYLIDQDRAQLQAVQDQHREEIAQITQALANNTLALQRLTDLLAYQEGVPVHDTDGGKTD